MQFRLKVIQRTSTLFSTSKRIEMKHFRRYLHTLLVKLYTPDVTRELRLCYNDNNIFRANILLNNKTQQFRFLILKIQVFNGK